MPPTDASVPPAFSPAEWRAIKSMCKVSPPRVTSPSEDANFKRKTGKSPG
jgi:hypothetical protein